MKPERVLTASDSKRALLSNRVTKPRRMSGCDPTGRTQPPKNAREERKEKFKSRQSANSTTSKSKSFKIDKVEKDSRNGPNLLSPLFCTRKSTSSQKETKDMMLEIKNVKSENDALIRENGNVKKKLGEIERTLTQKDHWISSLEKRLYGNASLTETKQRNSSRTVTIADQSNISETKKMQDAATNTDAISESVPQTLSPTVKIMTEKGCQQDVVDSSMPTRNDNEQNNSKERSNPKASKKKNQQTFDAVDLIDLESSVGNCPSSSSSASTIMQDLEKQGLEKQLQMQKDQNTQLLSKILRLQGNIQVCCRIRPMNADELRSRERIVVEPLSGTEVGCYDDKIRAWRSFVFDKVWGPDHGQEQVFADIEPYALSVVDGYNSCIFAYGQTGSGKTYTLQGKSQQNEHGVSYRIIQKIINLLETRKEKDARYEFKIELSMLEIYNDDIYDLLNHESSRSIESSQRRFNRGLSMKRGIDSTIEVIDLKKVKVFCIEDVMNLFYRGTSNRAAAATNLNQHSSRSHMVLNVRVTAGLREQVQSVGELFLVDLAGSERIGKSGVDGDEMKEARHINKSLSALGNVMEALDQKASHIPFRSSKLTHLLQDALNGNSKTMMLVNISPTELSHEESTSTLQFAMRARRINLGVAQQNVKSKNLEDTVNSLRMQIDLLSQAKRGKDEQYNELKKLLERNQERLAKFQKEKEKAFEVLQIATRTRRMNQGVAEQNVKTKNLQETIRNYKRQTRTLTEAKKAKDDEIAELKKSLRSTQEKLEKMQDERMRESVLKSNPLSESRWDNPVSQKLGSDKGSVRSNCRKDELSRVKKRLSSLANKGSSMKNDSQSDDFSFHNEKPSARNSLSVYSSIASAPKMSRDTTYGSELSDDDDDDDAVHLETNSCSDTRKEILALLKKHYPKKVDKIDLLLEKTKGDEKELLERITNHIEKDGKTAVKDVSSMAGSVQSSSENSFNQCNGIML